MFKSHSSFHHSDVPPAVSVPQPKERQQRIGATSPLNIFGCVLVSLIRVVDGIFEKFSKGIHHYKLENLRSGQRSPDYVHHGWLDNSLDVTKD
jgi:hypothetical protein